MPSLSTLRRPSLFAGIAAAVLAGCATTPHSHSPDPATARDVPLFAEDGTRLAWTEVVARAKSADVVILGEQHDDVRGHQVQRAIVEDAADAASALSLEMLERDEQVVADDYADGLIDAEQLAELTRSTNWAGKGSWAACYQPIIDAALANGAVIVAANAPRRYVRVARRDEGYEQLADLPPARRALVDLPEAAVPEGYRERFGEVMGEEGELDDSEAHAADLAVIESLFRAQRVWDATMAESIARAKRGGADRVIHLVGAFHCDFGGGLVEEIRSRLPGATILVISIIPERAEALRSADADRADVIAYTR